MPKKLYGPCSVKNCEFKTSTFCNFTNYGYEKSLKDGTFHQYNYLKVGDQICLPHYLSIVSSDRISRYRNKKPSIDSNEKGEDKNNEENELGKPTENNFFYMGHTATKPDKVNILLCDMNERLIVMWL
jgi:hypothetical protein